MGAQNVLADIDPTFIVPEEHRPTAVKQAYDDQIPVIDLSLKDHNSLASQIGSACESWGFFQVINHGISPTLLRKLRAESSKFFALPLQEKLKSKRDMQNPFGYYDTELTKNTRDWKQVFDFVCHGSITMPAAYESDEVVSFVNRWPENPPELKEACESYAKAVEGLCFTLLGLVSLSLGLPRNHFDEFFRDHISKIRLNYYAPCPSPDLVLGVSRHKDVGALTVLAQDEEVEGLQVKRKDGTWIGVTPVPGSLVINVGDCIQVWSNDKYESVEHRVVVNEKKERYSVPFFFIPSHYVMLKPVAELTDENNPSRYREFNVGKFIRRRSDGNFKQLGAENLQIHHFRS
eukprot:TRINITY_DN74_c0_g1_i1.p1 TRINITY_DN74_c0_g1~~TRINITY_DN74_c0_g1_i1.p1  ORF type:complete len:347 (+),score=23.75 TRINITY_DN74_c0_g1_i1:198-1238(+)